MPKSLAPPVADRLKHLRERSGRSMAETARLLGFRGASSYQRYEDAGLFRKPYLPLDLTEKLARVLAGRGLPPITQQEVMALGGVSAGPARRMIPLVGIVGAGAEVFAIEDAEAIDEVECPWSELAPDTVAVRVRGDSMAPAYYDRDLIFYERQETDVRHLLGKECVVALDDGRRFIKQLRRTGNGEWYLHSHNAEPILGIKISWAAKVRLIQRAE